jgi:hypothetical protein
MTSERRFVVLFYSVIAAALAIAFHYQEPAPPQPHSNPAGTPAQQEAAINMIRAFGYQCDSVDAYMPYVLSEGVTVWCDHLRYRFYIENHGGRWSVKSD